MASKNSDDSRSGKKNGKKRLAGGPTLPDWANEWWDGESDRVKEIESQAQPSIPTLLTKIARADLDLTSAGIARYVEADRLYEQKTKQKIKAKVKAKTTTS